MSPLPISFERKFYEWMESTYSVSERMWSDKRDAAIVADCVEGTVKTLVTFSLELLATIERICFLPLAFKARALSDTYQNEPQSTVVRIGGLALGSLSTITVGLISTQANYFIHQRLRIHKLVDHCRSCPPHLG